MPDVVHSVVTTVPSYLVAQDAVTSKPLATSSDVSTTLSYPVGGTVLAQTTPEQPLTLYASGPLPHVAAAGASPSKPGMHETLTSNPAPGRTLISVNA